MRIAKRKIIVLLGSAAAAALLWRLLWQIDFRGVVAVLSALRWWHAAAVVAFPCISFAIAAFRWGLLLRLLGGPRVSFLRLWRMTFAGAAVSLIAPSASVSGDVTKGMLLSQSGIPRPKVFASVAIDSFGRALANTGMSFLLAAAVLLGTPLLRGAQWPSIAAIWVLGGALILAIIFRRILRRKGSIVALVERFIPNHAANSVLREFDAIFAEALHTFRLPVIAVLISIIGFSWEIAQAWAFLRFLGAEAAFPALLAWYAFVTLPRMLPVAGGIGFVEAAGVFAAELFGVEPAFGLGFVLLGRARDLVILLVGAAALVSDRFRRAPTP